MHLIHITSTSLKKKKKKDFSLKETRIWPLKESHTKSNPGMKKNEV